MILWCDGAHDPAENMRRDAGLLGAAESGAPAVLRIFRFDPHGITLGMNQDPARELDLARCRAAGIRWAVRPTGGRTIFHAEEWTYALAASLEDPDWGGALADAYGRVSDLVVRSLVRLGVPADLAPRTSGAASLSPRSPRGPAPPCFASTARREVMLGGRKLAGSAQRRTDRAFLQQGSVLVGDGHLRLADFLALPEAERDTAREVLRRATAGAAAWLGDAPPLERWADALLAELGPRSSRFDAEAGAFLLTAPATGSYTAHRSK